MHKRKSEQENKPDSKAEEIVNRIVSRVNERTGGTKPCMMCGETEWRIVRRFVRVSVSNDSFVQAVSGDGFPLQPVVCQICGNTVFLNLLILGFTDDELKEMIYPENAPDE